MEVLRGKGLGMILLMRKILGVDIGGTGVKGALVEFPGAHLIGDPLHLPTPQPATPASMAKTITKIVQHFQHKGPVGVGFPGIIRGGVVGSATHLASSWVGKNAEKLFKQKTRRPFAIVNDADAAGLAEMHHGAGKKVGGTVVLITLGTGIGSALFLDGVLLANTELGHLTLQGRDAEELASAKARSDHNWGWKKWARKVREYLQHVDRLINPDLIIVGGGVSKRAEKWLPRASEGVRAKVVSAKLHNEAGIVGAAMVADAKFFSPKRRRR